MNPYIAARHQPARPAPMSRIDLLLAMYDGAIERLQTARGLLKAGNAAAARPLVARVQLIVSEIVVADVESIKSMKDAIEKHASTIGYIVSIDFVDVADKDTFKVNVDTDTYEVATNWSGGDPKGFAHELHHMLAFPLDRYDYTGHATNQSMEVSNRLYWFGQELTKPAGYNVPTSIMNDSANPNDDDACTVAGLPVPECIASRQKVTAALNDLTKTYKTPDERILNCIVKLQKTDASTMMGVLREILRGLFGLPAATKLVKRLKSKDDVLGKTFQTLSADQQNQVVKIIGP